MTETPAASSSDYDVVLLIEQALTAADAAQVRSLHEGIEDPVTYHVLLPMDDAAVQVEAAMGSVVGGEMLASPAVALSGEELQAIRDGSERASDRELAATLAALTEAGASVTGTVVTEQPIDALAAKVKEVDGREAIILTRPHVVAEFFHVDWSSQARRRIGVPVLHLLEHETFDEQAEGYGGEGVTGL